MSTLRLMVVGLGSNLGDRERTLEDAFGALLPLFDGPIVRSSLWLTKPIDAPAPQDDYLNAAIAGRSPDAPRDMLASLWAIEDRFGRIRRERNGARTLDLDLLWIEGVTVNEPGLTVPHERLRQRAFALAPLVEVAPEARDPVTGERYAEVLAGVGMTGVVRWPAALRGR